MVDDPLYVRDLKPGMRVPVGAGKLATVLSAEFMNGRDGSSPRMISNGETAVAIKVCFEDHEPLIAHPGEIVK